MRVAKPPDRAAAEVFALIRQMSSKGRKVTLGILWRKLGRSKTTVCETLQRLERDGWIKRPKHRPGLSRSISLKGS